MAAHYIFKEGYISILKPAIPNLTPLRPSTYTTIDCPLTIVPTINIQDRNFGVQNVSNNQTIEIGMHVEPLEIASNSSNLQSNNKKLPTLKPKETEMSRLRQQMLDTHKQDIAAKDGVIDELTGKVKELQKEVDKSNKQISRLKLTEDIKKLKNKYESLTNVVSAQEQTNKTCPACAKLKTERDDLFKKCCSQEELIAELSEDKKLLIAANSEIAHLHEVIATLRNNDSQEHDLEVHMHSQQNDRQEILADDHAKEKVDDRSNLVPGNPECDGREIFIQRPKEEQNQDNFSLEINDQTQLTASQVERLLHPYLLKAAEIKNEPFDCNNATEANLWDIEDNFIVREVKKEPLECPAVAAETGQVDEVKKDDHRVCDTTEENDTLGVAETNSLVQQIKKETPEIIDLTEEYSEAEEIAIAMEVEENIKAEMAEVERLHAILGIQDENSQESENSEAQEDNDKNLDEMGSEDFSDTESFDCDFADQMPTDTADDTSSCSTFGAQDLVQLEMTEDKMEKSQHICKWVTTDQIPPETCEKVFTNISEMVPHVMAAHASGINCTCLWLNCRRYDQPFKFKNYLMDHLRVHTRERPFSCPHPNCGKMFSHKQTVVNHMSTHNRKTFPCLHPGCGKTFAHKQTADEHSRIHTGTQRFVCTFENCSKSFPKIQHLEAHTRTHTGEKPFACDFPGCNKAFAYKTSLETHHNVHTGEKPFCCSYQGCDRRFAHKSSLDEHIRAHTGERPFPCPFPNCNKTFVTRKNLKIHKRIHTGEKPFTCPYERCGRKFTCRQNFLIHKRRLHTRERPFQCEFEGCDRNFVTGAERSVHYNTHTHEKVFTCKVEGCGKQYSSAGAVRKHMKSHNKPKTLSPLEALLSKLSNNTS